MRSSFIQTARLKQLEALVTPWGRVKAEVGSQTKAAHGRSSVLLQLP